MFTLENDDDKVKKENRETGNKNGFNPREFNMGIPVLTPDTAYVPVESKILTDDEYRKKRLIYGDLTPEEKAKEKFLFDHKKMFIRPEYTPQKSLFNYARSVEAASDIADTFYKDSLKGTFDIYKDDLNKKVKEIYGKGVKFPGLMPSWYNAEENLRANPNLVMNTVLDNLDMDKLRTLVAPYAKAGGFDVDDYIELNIKPMLRDKMYAEFIQERTPDNELEYILRSAFEKSLVGKTARIIHDDVLGLEDFSRLDSEGLANYNPSRTEEFFSSVGGLLIDIPAFKLFGAAGSGVAGGATNMAIKRIASRIMSGKFGRGVSSAAASKIAERAIINKLSTKILQSSLAQGITLGTYDAAHSVADDILNDSNIDFGKALGAFGKGFATGNAVGAVGTPIRHATAGLTGGKKLLASAGVLSAESAVFTAGTEVEKMMNGIEILPIDLLYDFGESAATLGVMKVPNAMFKGIKHKLGMNGKLKRELQLTEPEQEELRAMNVDPVEFMTKIEKALKIPFNTNGGDIEAIKEDYVRLMTSDELSASTRAKLMFVVESRLTSTPPIAFSVSVDQAKDGTFLLNTYDYEGQRIERIPYATMQQLESKLFMEKSNIRKNRIIAFERELTRGIDSQNFIRQAGIFAKENNISAQDMAEILYKQATGKEMAVWEKYAVDEVLKRSAYDETGIVQMLEEKRRELENKYGLPEGSLMTYIDQPFFRCTPQGNKALDEYAEFVGNEVERLKTGTDKSKSLELQEKGLASDKRGISNEEVKRMEVEAYEESIKEPEAEISVPVKPIEIGKDSEDGHVWSYYNHKHSRAEIEDFHGYASELARRYGYNIDVIMDEREIPLPDLNDKYAIMDYNNKIQAMGWVGKDGICLNLPNMKSREDIEVTVVHEVVGHKGLSELFGNHLNDFLEEVYVKADGEVLEGINRIGARYKNFDHFTIVEEYLAHLVEKARPSLQERTLLRKFKDFIKTMLLKLNIYTGRNRRVSEEELEWLMGKHAEYMYKRRSPSSYRRSLFGRFDASRMDKRSYYDRDVYDGIMREKGASGTLLHGTPEFLRDRKAFLNYEFLPEEKKKIFLEKWNETDENVMKALKEQKYRFIGEKGAGNISRYEGLENGDPDLPTAMQLERHGASPYDIKLYTGWERGTDGKWRKEMSDNALEVRDYMHKALMYKDRRLADKYLELKKIPRQSWGDKEFALWNELTIAGKDAFKDATLKDIIHDPSFNQAYPELMSLPVTLVVNPGVPIRYDSKNKRMLIDRELFVDPNSKINVTGALQNLIQDYEGFSKAVSMNLMWLNSEMKKRYDEIMKDADAIKTIKTLSSNTAEHLIYENTFYDKYGFMPDEFIQKFPSFDEYMIYRLTGKNFSFSGDAEMRNVMRRSMEDENTLRGIPAELTEDVSRDVQIPIRSISELREYFKGPLDIVFEKLKEMHSDDPIPVDPNFKYPVRSRINPFDRSDYEVEFDNYLRRKIMEYNQRQKEWRNKGYRPGMNGNEGDDLPN